MEAFPMAHSTPPSRPSGNTAPSFVPSPPPAPKNIFQRLWDWWSTTTGPRKENFEANIFAQEQLRRARLVSALLLLIVLVVALLVPSVYPSSPSIWIPIIILSVGGMIIALCNRAGYTTLSSVSYVLLIDIALTGFFYFKPTPALNSTNMTAFDLFIIAVLVGGVILPKRFIPWSGMLQILLISLIFFLRPKDATMIELIQIAGNPYVALMSTFVLHLVGTSLAWLHAWSVENALIRASQAEELAEAREELSQQASYTAKQKQRLEEGITSILETHRKVSAGNLAARAPVHEDHELWQIGHSLNLLLMRVQQQEQDYRVLQATCQEIEKCIQALDATRSGRQPVFPTCRTPLAQRLINNLRR
ncbi:hypothetical protein [Tengunoibacter tsumagoiensis]|uniref:HAMP domain-containing protein n=1 Tax=Tengunoibacter tsumagoiensis TaxID=2014871 RepID=A0A402A5Z6_9CHLR|nr:hypothetical protein [Tengunoibacter tsumagoiensis]GCE14509.1 hypothetical protein KTT_43680 [Tengunoibacter tsumagoiensis]